MDGERITLKELLERRDAFLFVMLYEALLNAFEDEPFNIYRNSILEGITRTVAENAIDRAASRWRHINRGTALDEQQWPEQTIKRCPTCRALFIPTRSDQVYCSQAHGNTYRSWRHRGKVDE